MADPDPVKLAARLDLASASIERCDAFCRFGYARAATAIASMGPILRERIIARDAAAPYRVNKAVSWLAKAQGSFQSARGLALSAGKILTTAGTVPVAAKLALIERGLQLVDDMEAFALAAGDQAGRGTAWLTLLLSRPPVRGAAAVARTVTSAQTAASNADKAGSDGGDRANESSTHLVAARNLWKPGPTPLSRLRITGPANIIEGNAGSQMLTFVVKRSGDFGRTCSARWTHSGTATASDFVTGQVLAGGLSWPAGDGSDRSIIYQVRGDLDVELDETVRPVLSDPVGCVIDLASAWVTIVGDDLPPIGAELRIDPPLLDRPD